MKLVEETVEVVGLNDQTDEELAQQAASGSHLCFEKLIFRYSSRLYQFLRTRIPYEQDVEDLVQDTFIKAFQNLHRFDCQRKFSTWLYTIASRLAIDYYRTHGRRKKQIDFMDGENNMEFADNTVSRNPQESLLALEETQNLWRSARKLKPDLYEVLWLRYSEEMSIQEISEVMKKKQISTRVLLHRARTKLSELMQKNRLLPHDSEENEDASVPTFSY